MTRAICIIDDSLPGEAISNRLDQGALSRLLQDHPKWTEVSMQQLVKTLLDDSASWVASAFVHPEFYLKCLESEGYTPDIIVFDWDYAAKSHDTPALLLEILQKSFGIVFIHSAAGNETQINDAIETPRLLEYKGKRLFILMKDENDAVAKLIKQSGEIFDKNFSFKFGKEFRFASRKALEQVLVELGRLDINAVVQMFSDCEARETDINVLVAQKVKHHLLENTELIRTLASEKQISPEGVQGVLSFFAEKFAEHLVAKDFGIEQCAPGGNAGGALDGVARKIWSYRLYYFPTDNLIRRGDVVRFVDTGKLALVASADCDLLRLWWKNFGHVTLIPLYDLSKEKDIIQKKIGIARTPEQVQKFFSSFGPGSSITNPLEACVEGPFILPFVRDSAGANHTFMGFPKEVSSMEISAPAIKGKDNSERKTMPLMLDEWPQVERIFSVAEPFLTALIQNSLTVLSGQGAPDYPKIVLDAIKGDMRSKDVLPAKK